MTNLKKVLIIKIMSLAILILFLTGNYAYSLRVPFIDKERPKQLMVMEEKDQSLGALPPDINKQKVDKLIAKFKIDRSTMEKEIFTRKEAHEAVESLIQMGEVIVEPLIFKLAALMEAEDYSDTLEFIRGTLTKLGKIATPHLLKHINSGNTFLREAVINTLGTLRDERAILPLIEVFYNTEDKFSEEAFGSLFYMSKHDDEALVTNFIIDVLSNPDKYKDFYNRIEHAYNPLCVILAKTGKEYTYAYLRHLILTNPKTKIFDYAFITLRNMLEVNTFTWRPGFRKEIARIKVLNKKYDALFKLVDKISDEELEKRGGNLDKQFVSIIKETGDVFEFKPSLGLSDKVNASKATLTDS